MLKSISLILVLALLPHDYTSAQRPDQFQNKEFRSFKCSVHDAKTGKVINMALDPKSVASGTWVFNGTVTNPTDTSVTNLTLNLPRAEIDKIKLNRTETGRTSIDGAHGEKSGYSLTTSTPSTASLREVTYSGSLIDQDGSKLADYEAVTDPAPLVIVAVVALAAALCEAVIVINDCSNSQAILRSIEACKEGHGRPKVTIDTTFGVSFSPFKVGCQPNCTFECLPGT